MGKTVISRKVTINAPKQKVWDALADFGNVQNMSPNISSSYLTTEQKNGVGAERHCDFTSMGAQVEERIVEWNEGESLKIDIYERKNMPMIANILAEFKVEELDNKVVLRGSFEYSMSNGLGNVMNSLVMKKMNIKTWVLFLAGIKYHVETGENVEKGVRLDVSTVSD